MAYATQEDLVKHELCALALRLYDQGNMEASSMIEEIIDNHLPYDECECGEHCAKCGGLLNYGEKNESCDCDRCDKCEGYVSFGMTDETCDCKRCPHCSRRIIPDKPVEEIGS